MQRKAILFPPLAATLALVACAAPEGGYPSLAIRDVERAEGRFSTPDDAATAPAPLPTLSADMTVRLRQLEQQARQSHADFEAALPRATRRVAAGRGRATTTDAYLDGAVALADLEAIRSRTAVPLAELDGIYAENAIGPAPDPVIAATRDQVTALIAREDAALAQLAEGYS